MNKFKFLPLATGVGLMLAAGAASSDPINGSVSIADQFLSLPSAPTPFIVSGLETFNLNEPEAIASSPTGDFDTGEPLNPATAAPFSLGVATRPFVTLANGFVFDLASATVRDRDSLECDDIGLCGDEIAVRLEGSVRGPGLDPTFFRGNFTANGACTGTINGTGDVECLSDITASWSASLVALGVPSNGGTAPEPATIALLGLGLFGMAAARRRLAS